MIATETLVEYQQSSLIEKWTHKRVANHLLDSKLFNKLGVNDIFSVNPSTIHFAGFSVGKTSYKSFEIVNKSDSIQRLHIIPPQSQFFKIHYTKQERFAPGCTLRCRIEFMPNEWKYFYDCIRLHCPDEENLIIPIHGFPVADTTAFPSVLKFQNANIGENVCKYIPIRSQVPVEFHFTTKLLQKSQSFSVTPKKGVVPMNGEALICICYSPKRFATESVHIQLDVAQFDAPRLVCLVTGSCESKVVPLDLSKAEKIPLKLIRVDALDISPLARARIRNTRQLADAISEVPSSNDTEKEGIKISTALDKSMVDNLELWKSHAVVNRILLHDPNKLRTKDIRNALQGKSSEENRLTKAAKFEAELRKVEYKERQNQLIWQTTLGSDPLRDATKEKIINDRRNAWRRYNNRRGDTSSNSRFEESSSTTFIRISFRRTYRLVDSKPIDIYGTPTFDPYNNDFWRIKLERLELLQQASRAVLIRKRADGKIIGLRRLKAAFAAGRRSVNPEDIVERKSATKISEMGFSSESLKIARRKYVSELPIDVKENITDVPIAPMSFWVSTDAAFDRKPIYHSIRVTRQFQLLGFNNVGISNLSYASRNAPGRSFRSGAEDELTIGSVPAKPLAKSSSTENLTNADEKIESTALVAQLRVPSFMLTKNTFSTVRYRGYAFPAFFSSLPYGESDPDAQFCPIARYPTSFTSRTKAAANQLHERDVIKGIMTWKQLPAAGPLATAALPCSNQLLSLRFAESTEPGDLLPGAPTLLRRAPEADKDIISDLESLPQTTEVTLLPETVAAKFEIVKTQMSKPLVDRPGAGGKGRKGQPETTKTREQIKKSERDAAIEEAIRPCFKASTRTALYHDI